MVLVVYELKKKFDRFQLNECLMVGIYESTD